MLWCTLQIPHGEKQGYLKWAWQGDTGLSMEAVSRTSSHIPAGSPLSDDNTTLTSTYQNRLVNRHPTDTCHKTSTWLVPQELQNGPHKTYCSSVWKAQSSQLRILIVLPFQLWLCRNIIASTFVPDKRGKNMLTSPIQRKGSLHSNIWSRTTIITPVKVSKE